MRALVGIGPQRFEDRDPAGQRGSDMDREEDEVPPPDAPSKRGVGGSPFGLCTLQQVEPFRLQEIRQVVHVLGGHDPPDHRPVLVACLVRKVRHSFS